MSDQAALLAAIIASPGDDALRLIYADWLDENRPDKTPSPAHGPSARAEYIRVQCQLAQFPFDHPNIAELLQRELDLADWLYAHVPDNEAKKEFPKGFDWYAAFDHGDESRYVRGFPEEFEYSDYQDETQENIDAILTDLPGAFTSSPARTLRLENAYGEEIEGVVTNSIAAELRGLVLFEIDDGNETGAIRGIARSKFLTGLRRLYLEFTPSNEDYELLAKANLPSLEHLMLDHPGSYALKALGSARWFLNLKSLLFWTNESSTLTALANLPPMPNLVSLRIHGRFVPTTTAMRRLTHSKSFPRLARLEFDATRFDPDHLAILARGKWPMRYLKLESIPIRKAGAEAIANAAFAESLRVLHLSGCEITAGGVQALAGSERLTGLRHLNLSSNPIGSGGLSAIGKSKSLRGLTALDLESCNIASPPLTTVEMQSFLNVLDMPELRHLRLSDMPVGIRGAKRIAAGGSFANLTRLELTTCGLRERGMRAIVESSALPHLTALDLVDNAAGKGVAKLADPKVHPRLGRCYLGRNKITGKLLTRLQKRPGIEV